MKRLRHALLTEGVKYTNRNGFKYTVLRCYNRDKYLMTSEEGMSLQLTVSHFMRMAQSNGIIQQVECSDKTNRKEMMKK